jgi:hypothetical protein
VQSIDVEFSETIDLATLDVSDLVLNRDGSTTNLLAGESRLVFEYRSGNVYRISGINWVQAFSANPQVANFTFTLNGNSIRDAAGNIAIGSASDSWTIDLEKPSPIIGLQLSTQAGPVVNGIVPSTAANVSGTLAESGLAITIRDMTTDVELGRSTITGTQFDLPIVFPSPGIHRLRVRQIDLAGNSTDTFIDNLFVQERSQLELKVSLDSISENGGTAIGTVTRSTPTTSELTVNLASSNVLAGRLPASIVIPAGQTSATFTITAVNDALADGSQLATITASATGQTSASKPVTVTDDEIASLVLIIAPKSISEKDGSAIGTITRNTPTASDMTVNVTSSNAIAGTAPTTVVIFAGQVSATFTFTAMDVDASQTTLITVSTSGLASATESLTVTDDSSLSWQNPGDKNDVDDDTYISPLDVLIIINSLNSNGIRQLPTDKRNDPYGNWYIDVNGDGYSDPLDALILINYINARSSGGVGEGEALVRAANAVDQVFSEAAWLDDEIVNTSISRFRTKRPRQDYFSCFQPRSPDSWNSGRSSLPRSPAVATTELLNGCVSVWKLCFPIWSKMEQATIWNGMI